MAAPINNKGGRKSDKLWRDALMIAVKRTAEQTAEVLEDPKAPMVAKAAASVALGAARGDKDAYREIGDRLDGKPAQSVTVSGDADAPLVPTINVTISGPSAPPQTGTSASNKRD